jgi:hypothetical protein
LDFFEEVLKDIKCKLRKDFFLYFFQARKLLQNLQFQIVSAVDLRYSFLALVIKEKMLFEIFNLNLFL